MSKAKKWEEALLAAVKKALDPEDPETHGDWNVYLDRDEKVSVRVEGDIVEAVRSEYDEEADEEEKTVLARFRLVPEPVTP